MGQQTGGPASTRANPLDTSLSQTGLVPLNAKTLLFKAFFPGTGPNLAISLGGQPLSYSLISSGTGYGEYGADIHQWAGQTAELTLTALTQRPHQFDEYAFLDSIEFSATSIPSRASLPFPLLAPCFCFGAFCVKPVTNQLQHKLTFCCGWISNRSAFLSVANDGLRRDWLTQSLTN